MRFNQSSPQDRPPKDIPTAIVQIWNKILLLEDSTKQLVSNASSTNSIQNVLDYIKAIFGHTSAMPDRLGTNADHDERYLLKSTIIDSIVTSVNGKTGDVVLNYEDVGADKTGSAAAARRFAFFCS
jgi:hypothetical protein